MGIGTNGALLELCEVYTQFFTTRGVVRAVDGVSLKVGRRESVGIVGESGCGKSVTALSIMRLVPEPPGRVVGGSIVYKGRDLLSLSEEQMRNVRGGEISMVFQDPMTFLNPIMRVGDQIGEVIRLHQGLRDGALRKAIVESLGLAHVPSPEAVAEWYPHQLSGGMRQRALIAMALACHPTLLIADEPTTALDVTIQAQILQLLKRVIKDLETALLLISHDLSVVAYMCDRIYVMYAGKVVEEALSIDLYERPVHPYTQGLLRSVPSVDRYVERFPTIEGVVPDLLNPPSGCRFADRCAKSLPICRDQAPAPVAVSEQHRVSCWLHHPDGSEK